LLRLLNHIYNASRSTTRATDSSSLPGCREQAGAQSHHCYKAATNTSRATGNEAG